VVTDGGDPLTHEEKTAQVAVVLVVDKEGDPTRIVVDDTNQPIELMSKAIRDLTRARAQLAALLSAGGPDPLDIDEERKVAFHHGVDVGRSAD
jgi:hypothetical protein